MSDFICEFCNSTFAKKSNLTNHQKNAKFCLAIQGKENNNFICEFCNKKLSTKNALGVHILTCKYKLENNPEKLIEENEELRETNLYIQRQYEQQTILKDKEYEQQTILKDKEIEAYKEIIKKLENKIEKLEDTIIGIAEAKQEILSSNSIENQVQELTNKYGRKKQKRQQIKEPNVIYILTTPPLKNERRYILGKSKNLTSRLSTYNKTDEHEIIYYQTCGSESNMDTVEKIVLNRLDKYRELENRDRFILPENENIELFIDIIKKSIQFILEI
jgi:hypothetical protein